MHDINNTNTPLNILKFFQNLSVVHSYNSRSSISGKFYVQSSRLEIQKRSFSRFGVKLWNEILQRVTIFFLCTAICCCSYILFPPSFVYLFFQLYRSSSFLCIYNLSLSKLLSLARPERLTLPAGQSYSLKFCINKLNVVVMLDDCCADEK